MKPIGSNLPDTISISSGLAAAVKIKNPNEMFFLDDTYFYAGQVNFNLYSKFDYFILK